MRRFGIVAGWVLLLAASATAQGIQGVHPDVRPLQVGAGFTFISFNETPSTTQNNAGFNGSAVYYQDFLGAEGDFTETFGSNSNRLLFSGGGVRLRWPGTRTIEPWIHGLVGVANISPKPTFGSGTAFGYKTGGGIDYNPRHGRLIYRVSADLIGAHFFKTYQLSPEVTVGVAYILGGTR